jgi:hypothetical protein
LRHFSAKSKLIREVRRERVATAVFSPNRTDKGVAVEELTIIEVTRDGFVAVSRDGQRFSIPLNGSIRSQLSVSPLSQSTVAVSPKEIQALLRSGLSVADVAARTGSSAEHIARFESPIVAELAFVLERALSVPVVGNGADSTFGAEITARIAEQGGAVAGWQAYRIDDVWVVGARCLVGSAEEDATWSFDPRKMTLVPSNAVAIRISRSDSADATLFPPLRVMPPQPLARFDSGEFEPIPPATTNRAETTDTADATAADEAQPVPQNSSIVIDVESVVASTKPAAPIDLVDEIERRRGDRRDAIASHPSTGSIPIITPDMLEVPDDSPVAPDDVPATQVSDSADVAPAESEVFVDPTPSRSRRQRATMPTWDEIVFGTRPDDA